MADKSKDTGTGGINIDGKVKTMDVGVPDSDAEKDAVKPVSWSSGDVSVDKTIKDISKPSRETFAKYLSKTTLASVGDASYPNAYPVGNGDQTVVEESSLHDANGIPVPPGPQNNDAKFSTVFNNEISSNNPAGIKRGLTTGTGQDGNTLLPSASTAADPGGNYVKFVTTSGVKGLQEPIKTYTNTTIDPNLYDYDSNKVGISDGTLNQSPSGLREDIRIISTNSNVETDGGTSKNILGADNAQGDYTLTAVEARTLAGTTTAKNRFPIDNAPSVVTFRDTSGNPVSVTASQNNVTNTSFFTKLVEEKEEGGKTVQVISVRELSSYTPALTSAASVNANKFEIKRGKTAGGTIDGNELLLTIAPEAAGVATLTPAAQTYTDEVIKPNLNNYSTTEVGISDGALGAAPLNTRENLKYIPSDASIKVDGGKSVNILGADAAASPDYTLTLVDRATQASIVTAGNFFKVDAPTVDQGIVSTAKIVLSTPLSATDAQENPFASSFFTKEVQKVNNVDKVFSKLRSSYTSALTAAQIAQQNKFVIKRGKTEKIDGIDGNALLSAIAPEANGVATLSLPATTYTDEVLKPNLRDYADYTAAKKAANLSGDAQQENLYDLQKTTDLTTDGGTSKNILDPTKKVPFTAEAELAKTLTTMNFFPVDSPVDNGVLNIFKLDSSAVLAKTKNEKSFTDIKIGSNVVVGSKGKLVVLDPQNSTQKLPDGNKLLPEASTRLGQGSGLNYVRFVTSTEDGRVGLLQPIKGYTNKVVEINLRDYTDYSADKKTQNLSGDAQFVNLYGINKTTDLATDGGASRNVLDPTKTIPFEVEAELARTTTTQNYYPVDSPVNEQTLSFNLFKLNSAAGLASTNNNARFADVKIGVNSSIFSKGKLVVLDPQNSTQKLPDGNELLPGATAIGEAGPYVKLSGPLNDPIKSYVTDLFSRNIRPIGEVAIYPRGEPFDQFFFGPAKLHVATLDDRGTFDNIVSDPTKRQLTKNDALARLKREVAGENGLGGIPNNFTPFDTTKIEDYQTDDKNVVFDSEYSLTNNGYPRSPSVEQGVVDESATWKFEPNLAKVSSYSAEGLTILGTNIRRGKSDFQGPDGNDLLRRAAPAVTNQSQFIKLTNLVDDTPVAKYVGAVLEKNRYTEASRFVNPNTPGAPAIGGLSGEQYGQSFENISDSVSEADRPNSLLQRTTLYSPRSLKLGESPQSTIRRGEQIQGYTFRRLTRIGTILQLRAAGEFTFLAQDDADPRSNTQQLAALLPGAGQLLPGVPFSRELLNVTEIVKTLPDDDITGLFNTAAKYEGELIDIGRSFEGTVNTTLEKFSGFSAIGLIILSIVLVAVILVAINALFGGLIENDSLNKGKDKPGGKAHIDANDISYLGVFQGTQIGGGGNIVTDIMAAAMDKSAAIRLFGIMPTYNNDYSDALMRGSFAFFGLGAEPPPLLAFPGQVIVTSRAIVRGVAQLVKALADLALTLAAGSITSAIFKLLDIIEVIKNSRVIKAVNTFSQLGDRKVYTVNQGDYVTDFDPTTEEKQNLAGASAPGGNNTDLGSLIRGNKKEKYQRTEPNERLNFGKKFSEIDSIVNSGKHDFFDEEGKINLGYIGISHAKNRLQNSRALAWSSYRSPSLLLDPTNVPAIDALKRGSVNSQTDGVPYIGSTDVDAKQFLRESVNMKSARIDPKTVTEFEEAMDGEYMPFYFHDLRTNEIIGFHAFLLSLSDDYSASYESVSGIGRIEPIRTYKDTQRKIGLSFMLAALDEKDFNHMWEKINKLTMLVYPQFTRGKQYKNETAGVTFDKPFTQMIGAAPMIRLRLGNLFRSNYSRYNIAGIFGLNSGEAVLPDPAENNKVINLIDKTQDEVRKRFKADKRNMYKVDRSYRVMCASVYRTKLDEATSNKLGLPPEKPDPTAAAVPKATPQQIAQGVRYIEKGDWYRTFQSDANSKLRFKIKKVLPERSDQPPEYAIGVFTVEKTANEKERSTMPSPVGKEFYVPIKDIEMDQDSKNAYEADLNNVVGAAPQGAVNEFLSPEKNAIVRSFESTKGRGLAGFIDSLSFDWYDRVTWDLSESRKAPKMCKVTISFTPVHDITPGLDAAGNNRAPIYQLGPYGTELVRGR